jgi:hypothetical protein
VLVATEPHLAFPVWVAVLLFAPRTRLAVVLCGCALIALNLALGGVSSTLAYFAHVLPLQALSEVHANDQYSLTHQLALLGVPDRTALLWGSISYIVMVIAGLYVAARFARNSAAADYVALVPPAFVLFGGSFVHDVQFMAALPLAIVVLVRRPSAIVIAGTLFLCIAWGSGAGRLGLVVSAASAAAVIWLALDRAPRAVRFAWSAAALCIVAIAVVINLHHAPATQMATPDALDGNEWAPVAWQQYLAASPDRTAPHLFDTLRKLPEWAGLIAVLVGTWIASAPHKTIAPAPEPLIAETR